MGINVKIQKAPKPADRVVAYAKLERDLKSCMRCRFFYGNNSQCIASRCVKEDLKPQEILNDKCLGCTYPQSEGYCFPCMKEILGHTKKENQKDMEEDEDG